MLTLKTNITEVINGKLEKLQAIIPGGEVYEKAMQESAEMQLAAGIVRVHTEGIASDGGAIGQYSTRPMYANPAKGPVSFSAEGKTGKTVFARTGQPHLTRYFAEGYKQYREQMGLPSDRVTLVLRGDLRDGLTLTKTSSGYGMGWSNADLQARAEALEERYGKKIWSPTEQEKANMVAKITESVKSNF